MQKNIAQIKAHKRRSIFTNKNRTIFIIAIQKINEPPH